MSRILKEMKSGIFFTALSKYSIVVVQIIVMAVLSRLITPEEFGIIAIVMVFIVFFNYLSNIGIGPAVIQNNTLDSRDISNIFYFTIIWGILMSIGYYGFSYLLKFFYSEIAYVNTAVYLCIIVFLNSIVTIPNALLRKNKKFKKIGLIDIISNVISGIVAIIMAIKGYSYYSILYQTITRSFLVFLGNLYYCNLKLYFSFSVESIKKILGYSIYEFASNMFNYFSKSMDNILIGKYLGAADLGYYDRAYRLILFPLKNLSLIISPVLHPVLRGDKITKEEIYKIYLKIIKIISIIGIPLSVFLYFSAREIITIMYGKNWDKSIIIFQLLSISLFAQLISSILKSFYLISGKLKVMLKTSLITNGLLIIFIGIGLYKKDMSLIAFLISLAFIMKFIIDSIVLNRIYFKNCLMDYINNIKSSVAIGLIILIVLYTSRVLLNFKNIFYSFIYKGSITIVIFLIFLYFTGELKNTKKILRRKKC